MVEHTWMREDGLRVDRMLLVTDTNYIPSGMGPAESVSQMITETVPGGLGTVSIAYQYDARYRLAGASYTGAITATYAYVYDAVGNMTAFTETVGVETTRVTRSFDAANRLQTAFDYDAGTTSYYYDDNGNLMEILPPGATGQNPVGGLRYAYDQRNLLITHTTYVSGTGWVLQAEYIYDGAGDRLQQVDHTGVTPVTTTYSNDVFGLTQVLVADDGTAQVYNLFGLDLISQDSGGEVRTLLADGLGSVRLEMVGGMVDTATTYEPYGQVLAQVGTSGTVYGFAGEQEDGATGLLYLRARYYNPALKTFMSRDPWEGTGWRPGTLNYYVYGLNNPILYTDPSGALCLFGFINVPGISWGGTCSERSQQVIARDIAFLGGFVSSPAFAWGFLIEFVDSIAISAPSTVAGVLQVILEDTALGRRASDHIGLVLDNCGANPDLVATILAPYSSLVNNPDPYFQLGRWLGRATALTMAVGQAIGGGSAMVASVVGAGPTGGAALLAIPAAAQVTAHGALVIGGIIAKEQADPLLLRLPALLSAAHGGGGSSEWEVGDPVDQPTTTGQYPSWKTVRERYWKNRAANAAPGEFSVQNLGRMRNGGGPRARIIARINETGREIEMVVTKEIHHISGRAGVRPHSQENLVELWPWEHARIDPARNLEYVFVRFK